MRGYFGGLYGAREKVDSLVERMEPPGLPAQLQYVAMYFAVCVLGVCLELPSNKL